MCKLRYKKTGWYIPGSWVPVRNLVRVERCPPVLCTTVPLTKVTLEPESIVLTVEHKKRGRRQEIPELEFWSDEDCIDYFKKAWSASHRLKDIDSPISLLCYDGLGELSGH